MKIVIFTMAVVILVEGFPNPNYENYGYPGKIIDGRRTLRKIDDPRIDRHVFGGHTSDRNESQKHVLGGHRLIDHSPKTMYYHGTSTSTDDPILNHPTANGIDPLTNLKSVAVDVQDDLELYEDNIKLNSSLDERGHKVTSTPIYAVLISEHPNLKNNDTTLNTRDLSDIGNENGAVILNEEKYDGTKDAIDNLLGKHSGTSVPIQVTTIPTSQTVLNNEVKKTSEIANKIKESTDRNIPSDVETAKNTLSSNLLGKHSGTSVPIQVTNIRKSPTTLNNEEKETSEITNKIKESTKRNSPSDAETAKNTLSSINEDIAISNDTAQNPVVIKTASTPTATTAGSPISSTSVFPPLSVGPFGFQPFSFYKPFTLSDFNTLFKAASTATTPNNWPTNQGVFNNPIFNFGNPFNSFTMFDG